MIFFFLLNLAKKENWVLWTFILFFLFRLYSPHSHSYSPHSQSDFSHSYSYSLHSHPDSTHSHPDSPHSHPHPRIPIRITCIPTPIYCIPILIPRISFIQFSDSTFWLLQIACFIYFILFELYFRIMKN